MGREIVYCAGCGTSLREDDFSRGKAHTVENRPFCIACRPVEKAPPPAPKASPAPLTGRSPRMVAPVVKVHSTRRIPQKSRTVLTVGLLAAAAALFLGVLLIGSQRGTPEPVIKAESPPSTPAAPPPEKPNPAPAQAAGPWFEYFAEGNRLMAAKDYSIAKTYYVTGLNSIPAQAPTDPSQRTMYFTGLYNFARILSGISKNVSGEENVHTVDMAFEYLGKALENGYATHPCSCHPKGGGLQHLDQDPEFDPIRTDPRYVELRAKYK